MKPTKGLLLLVLSAMSCLYANAHADSSSCSGSGHGPPAISIGTVVSGSSGQDQDNATSSSSFEYADASSDHEEPIDVMLVANSSISSSWLDGVVGYTAAAESKVLYQAASWTLLDEGTQGGKFASHWARFQAVNRTGKSSERLSVCAMVAEWNSSWSDTKSALSAVDLEDRLTSKCKTNDTIAVAFTSTVAKTAARYLKGEVAVNNVVAALKLPVVEALNRMFVRLDSDICPLDTSATTFSGLNSTSAPVISLVRGVACSPGPDSHLGPPPQPSSQGISYDSDWKHNLRVVIPVVVCILVLGCAGFIYVRRQKNDKASAANEAPKEESPGEEGKGEKEDASSQPYVLATQPV